MLGRVRPWRPWWSPDSSPRGNEHEKRTGKLLERRQVRASLQPAGMLPAPGDDPWDCEHGCNGYCLISGSDRCNFTCHPGLSPEALP